MNLYVPVFINRKSTFSESLGIACYTESMTEAVGTHWHPEPDFILYGSDQALTALDRHELRDFPATIILLTR